MADPPGRESVISRYGVTDVISAEAMLEDMRVWKPEHWQETVERLQRWSQERFSFLQVG